MTTDTNRMGLALGFPGIDPRAWISWAIVDAIKVTAAGTRVDITVIETGQETTVGVARPAGKRYGLYLPIDVGDHVVVAWNGSTGQGQIIGALWDTGSPAPAEVVDHPGDTALVARPETRMRLLAPDGSIVAGADLVLLGDENATAPVARVGDSVEVTIPMNTVIIANPLFPGIPPGSQPEFIPNPLPITLSGTITSGSSKVRSS